MKLVWKFGDEAICPGCHHGNACIGNGYGVYECRDCHRKWTPIGPTVITERITEGYLAGRVTAERECEELR